MPNTSLFNNAPQFCDQNLSTSEVLALPVIMKNLGLNADTSNYAKCGDPNLGTLLRKNLIHTMIRCGGKPIDINWMEEILSQANPTRVTTKRWFNRYHCDPDFNVYLAASVVGNVPGGSEWATLLRSNHGANGGYSLPQKGFSFFDKENQIQYQITDIDTSVPYAHRFRVTPVDATQYVNLKANQGYLIGTARIVGGCNCPEITNSMTTLGYTQEGSPIRVRRDWKLCVDLLTGYQDDFQFGIVYDNQGNALDGWDTKQQQEMREGIRSTLNLLAFMGTPITNTELVTGQGAIIDGNHKGFYGLLPTLKYGGGNVYDFQQAEGFDLEVDVKPILLFQDSRKRTKQFMVMHGAQFSMNMTDRTNNLVKRTGVGAEQWEAYKRIGSTTQSPYETEIVKLGIRAYEYNGFRLDLKKMDSWSDTRYMGSDYMSNLGIFMPQDGVSENGRPMDPIEFYQYGVGDWTGDYAEHYIDYRDINGCNDIGGWAAQSLGMAVHCPNQWIVANPVKAF